MTSGSLQTLRMDKLRNAAVGMYRSKKGDVYYVGSRQAGGYIKGQPRYQKYVFKVSSSEPKPAPAPKPAPKPAPPPPRPAPKPATYKPIPVTSAGKVTPAAAPTYNIANDPAYKALQQRLTSMQSDYKSQLSGLTGQISGLTGQLTASQDAYKREQELRAASEARMQDIARRQAYNQATNPQAGGVKVKRSDAYEEGLTSRGSTGYFGRSGLRISNLNL